MTYEEELCFAYRFAKHQITNTYAGESWRKYYSNKLNEISEKLIQLGCMSRNTDPIPCKVGDIVYKTILRDDGKVYIKKATVMHISFFEDEQEPEPQAELRFEDGWTCYIDSRHFVPPFSSSAAFHSKDEAEQFAAERNSMNHNSATIFPFLK